MQLTKYRGKWYAYWRENGKTRRISLRTTDKHLAEQALERLKQDASKPLETVEDIFLEYLKEKPKEKYMWRVLEPFWKRYRPYEITKDACKKYIKHREGKSTGTIHRELTMLRAALRWHDKNTPANFFFPPKPKPRENRLTKAECKKLIDACRAPHVRLFVITALTTAARSNAILGLKWENVSWSEGIIDFTTENDPENKRRSRPPINKTLRQALEVAYEARLSDYVIEYGGRRVKSIRRGVKEAGKRIGKDISPHVLRHSAACIMAENRVPMSEISQFLGHSSTQVTESVYARYSPDHLRKASDSLEF